MLHTFDKTDAKLTHTKLEGMGCDTNFEVFLYEFSSGVQQTLSFDGLIASNGKLMAVKSP